MRTQSLRVRLVFEDRSILTEEQRSDGMNHSWLLLKFRQHRTISDVCSQLLYNFELHHSCPNGILLSMEGYTLPPFESTEILKDKELICVKKKGGTTPNAGNLLEEVEDDDLLILENNDSDNAGEYQSESEEVDEKQLQDEELPEETVSKKRKASTNLHNLKKKKQRFGVLDDDDEDEAETEEIKNVNNDASHPMKINTKKKTNIKATTSNKKVKTLIVKGIEELQENVEEINQVSNTLKPKKISRSSRRKKAQRKRKREHPETEKKKPKAHSKRQVTKPMNGEANGQPKGLLYWNQDSKKFVKNGDAVTDAGPVLTRPEHIRFESPDRDQAAKPTGVTNGTFRCNSNSSKNKGQKWGRENFKKKECRRLNKESFKMVFKDSKVPVIDINDFDNLPPCSEPKEGDVIAYRLLELNSSWIPEFSSFRVGRISYYDAKDIDLIPVPEYPIVLEKVNDNKPNDSLYGEDGSLEINYSALVDVRNIKQHDPDATRTVNNGASQTPPSKDNINAQMENNLEVEVDPWARFSSKNTEISVPNHSGLNSCSYDEAGPSTSTGPDAYKAESSRVKEGQNGNSSDRWLAPNNPEPEPFQETNASTPDVKMGGPAEKDCENGSSWGRPWSAFVVSRGSSVIQSDKEDDSRVGSSRGRGKPWSRGATRGRGRGLRTKW